MSSSTNNTSIFTESELEERAIIKKARFDIIEAMTNDGPPGRSGDIRVLNEVMAATDKTIVDTANIRLKQEATANNGAMAASVIEMLKQTRLLQNELPVRTSVPVIAEHATDVELVPGEGSLDPEPLSVSDFVTPVFDPTQIDD